MVLFIILGVIVFITFVVLGVLFYMLSKEGEKNDNDKAVPVTDLDQLRNEISSHLFEQSDSRVVEKGSETIPVFETKPLKDPIPSISQGSLYTLGAEKQPSLEDDAYKKRAEKLEDELLAISKKADGQSDEARKMIETLTRENEELKSQKANLEEAHQKLVEMQGEASALKVENLTLQTQLETTNARARLLEEEMAAVKIQMGEEISRANAAVSELNREKELLLSAPKPEADQEFRQELENLRSEQVQLKKKCEDLEKTNEQLQYELIKARAQSSGLERVSFNYKNQFEDFLKKVNAAQVINDHLSQVKNRLEGDLEQVKSQNEELVKKDQLAQFELEKNHSRLVSLEREYEDLKARAQQSNQ